MPSYILRNLPPNLSGPFKDRAQREGWPLRTLFLRLIEDFGSGQIQPTGGTAEAQLRERLVQQVSGVPAPALMTRSLMITFQDGERTVSMPEVARAEPQSDVLTLFDYDGRMTGQINRRDIKSWWFEGGEPI